MHERWKELLQGATRWNNSIPKLKKVFERYNEQRQDFTLLYQAMKKDTFEKISSTTTLKEAWRDYKTSIKKLITSKKRNHLQTIRRKFKSLIHMKELKSISDYFSRVSILFRFKGWLYCYAIRESKRFQF